MNLTKLTFIVIRVRRPIVQLQKHCKHSMQ